MLECNKNFSPVWTNLLRELFLWCVEIVGRKPKGPLFLWDFQSLELLEKKVSEMVVASTQTWRIPAWSVRLWQRSLYLSWICEVLNTCTCTPCSVFNYTSAIISAHNQLYAFHWECKTIHWSMQHHSDTHVGKLKYFIYKENAFSFESIWDILLGGKKNTKKKTTKKTTSAFL